jgi:hypothetical protein
MGFNSVAYGLKAAVSSTHIDVSYKPFRCEDKIRVDTDVKQTTYSALFTLTTDISL